VPIIIISDSGHYESGEGDRQLQTIRVALEVVSLEGRQGKWEPENRNSAAFQRQESPGSEGTRFRTAGPPISLIIESSAQNKLETKKEYSLNF
jgi:hypothetical protein